MKSIFQVYKNVGASVLPQLVNIISNFILPVMIISLYGSSINGLLSTVKTIVAYISLVGAGISVATTQALYSPVAKGDIETVKGMLKATSQMFNKCGTIYLVIVFVISLIYPLLLDENIPYLTMVLLLMVVSVSGASEFFIVGRCRSLLYANQKVYVCTSIQAFSLIASLLLAIFMLKKEANIILVQFGISFVYVVRAFLLWLYVKKQYPQYLYERDTKPILSATAKRNDAMIHQLTGLVVLGSQSLILSLMVSLEAASIYSVYNIVFSGLYSICSNMNVAVTPFIGRSYAISVMNRIQQQFNCVEYLFFIITSLVFMICIVTILPFVDVYTKGADITYHYPLFAILFVATFIFNVFRLPHSSMINVAGMFRETRMRAIIEALICIVVSIIATYFCGLYGVLIGTCTAIGWRCLDMIVYSHKYILHEHFRMSVFRLIRSLIYCAFLYCLTRKISIEITTYIEWLIFTLKILLVAILIVGVDAFLLERKTLKQLKLIIRK